MSSMLSLAFYIVAMADFSQDKPIPLKPIRKMMIPRNHADHKKQTQSLPCGASSRDWSQHFLNRSPAAMPSNHTDIDSTTLLKRGDRHAPLARMEIAISTPGKQSFNAFLQSGQLQQIQINIRSSDSFEASGDSVLGRSMAFIQSEGTETIGSRRQVR